MCNSNDFGNLVLLRISQYDSVLTGATGPSPPPHYLTENHRQLTKLYGDDIMRVQRVSK